VSHAAATITQNEVQTSRFMAHVSAVAAQN
jgi:hypothetical protein